MTIQRQITNAKIYIIGDKDTVIGFLLAGAGNKDGRGRTNYTVVTPKMDKIQIENVFRSYVEQEDCGIIIINQHLAEKIRSTVNMHVKPIPSVVEVPSKTQPYDPSKDVIMKRIEVYKNVNSNK
ncbi:V-type H+-transporting ATPase subunit F [Babesia microti strain RI]|uniref:V-type proton ATPase subunit F n=1 Tax=Babesia microti (strain RI) TaxID=1133968 RepID=A0A1R4AAS0_BABMR|nr:V-type H+-transporting ATPase subunit F [Babesia microti strain RI]SJK86098.1 V-type H+-transporting ATPase subunit F [Babesia microti strain RI]|eukprot:XP_021338294.1 V-type H+-transporting ATPase subunit F [Babesia microti strain RI]